MIIVVSLVDTIYFSVQLRLILLYITSVISGVTQFSLDMKSSFEHIRVVDIKVHPLYDDFSLDNDFAVLYLERDSEASVVTLDDGESFDYHTGANMTTIVSNSLPFPLSKRIYLRFFQGIRPSRR